jgi:hypothetical protein
VFFIINLMSWTLLASDAIIDFTWDFCYVIWIVFALYLGSLAVMAKELQGGTVVRRYGPSTAPLPGQGRPEGASDYPVTMGSSSHDEKVTGIVVEALVVAGCCLTLLVFAYSAWMF